MFRFFRSLRHRLLAENRLGNYLLYALGEIVLVVIGILIALFLDDLHTQSKEREKELEYLHRFHDDLEGNLKELDRVVSQSDNILGKIDSIFALKYGEIPQVPTATFNQLNTGMVDYLALQLAEATVEDLIGSGTLGIIGSDSVREAIATWDSGLMVIRALEADHKKAFNELLEFFRTHTDVYGLMRGQAWFDDSGQQRMLEDRVYLNTLTAHAVPLQMLHEAYRSKRDELRRLSNTVQTEIRRKE